MKLNLKSIITAEKLLNKPFAEFDLSDEKDLKGLIYSVYVVNEKVFTMNDFENLWNLKTERKKMMEFVTTQIEYVQQFALPSDDGKGAKVWIGNLVNRLIATRRVEQSYILNDMQVWELSDILKAAEEVVKEEMEQKRFWAYLTVLPHVDNKKIKKPQDLITFPWEAEEFAKEKQEQLEKDKEMFEKFFNSQSL